MFKSKIAFIFFAVLSIIVFPYNIIYVNSDFFSSLVPSWNTTINSVNIISALIKFVVLSIVTFCYWKLSKMTDELNLKKFIIHLLLSILGVLISNINLYPLIYFGFHNPENFVSKIQIVVGINICINTIFFLAQILFGVFYIKLQKKLTSKTANS